MRASFSQPCSLQYYCSAKQAGWQDVMNVCVCQCVGVIIKRRETSVDLYNTGNQ